MFITLHTINGTPISVNPQNIDRIEPLYDGYLLVQTNGVVPAITVMESGADVDELVAENAEKTALAAVIIGQKVADKVAGLRDV